MTLNPLSTPLCVVQATISQHGERAQLVGLSMPSAPFGTLPWQLIGLANYIVGCQTSDTAPSPETFTAHMQARATSAIPSPATLYPYTPWHDGRVRLLLDVTLGPAKVLKWPQASLVIMEQESGSGSCDWVRLSRERTAERILTRTVWEIEAEAQLLAGRLREAPDPSTSSLLEVAQKAARWARESRKAARAALTISQAARARHALRMR
ncbi:hypothetical protein [Streptomyces sp. NPDC002952]|jgi:hypothetical protein|uniref:hypothetical protein n=1 Tax=Streptomyces sp. NPDC002952 TaxID=3364673 RepID=UPI0036AF7ED7